MGDMYTKVGPNNESLKQVMGFNENGKMFSNFCASHYLIIGGTIFLQKKCHHSKPNRSYSNRQEVQTFSDRCEKYIVSNHHLVLAEFKLRIMAAGKKLENRRKKVYVQKLKDKKNVKNLKCMYVCI
jgi:hypothetical protein